MKDIPIMNGYSNTLNSLTDKLGDFYESVKPRLKGKRINNDRIRSRIKPVPARTHIFSPDTMSWIKTCSIDAVSNHTNGSLTYTLPLLGITNRPLPGYRKGGLNLYKTIVHIIITNEAKRLDQCTIEFGLRLPISTDEFTEELYRQMNISRINIKGKGKIIFYSTGLCNMSSTADLQALRLVALKTMPVINIDWLDPFGQWDLFWNPCSDLKPRKPHLEYKLINLLDKLIQKICASHCNILIERTNSFLESVYLPHRTKMHLPAVNKILILPSANNQYSDYFDVLDKEKSLVNYIQQSFNTRQKNLHQKLLKGEWLPLNI